LFFACNSVPQQSTQPQRQQPVRIQETRTNVIENMVRWTGGWMGDNSATYILSNNNRLGNDNQPLILEVNLWAGASMDVLEHLTYWCKQIRFDPRRLVGNTIPDSAVLEIILNNGRVVNISDLVFEDNNRYNLARQWKANKPVAQTQQNQQQSRPQNNINKLTGNLLGGDGTMGHFVLGEQVHITLMLLRVLDLNVIGNEFSYLVGVNDKNAANRLAPFYIISSRRFNLIDLDFRNTINESFIIEFVGYGEYLSNGMPARTYIFKEKK